MQPVILFSHIPMSRPDGSSCGPLRERGTIRRGVGIGYQNTLGKQTSTFLLDSFRPTLIFRLEILHSINLKISIDKSSVAVTITTIAITVTSFD